MPGQQDVETPDAFFKAVEDYFKITFDHDMAADIFNAKTNSFFTEEDDALNMDWPRNCWLWLNPPFANLTKWVAKCYWESSNGSRIVSIWPLSGDKNQLPTWTNASVYIIHGRIWPKVRGCMLCVWDKEEYKVIAGLSWDKKKLTEYWRVYRG